MTLVDAAVALCRGVTGSQRLLRLAGLGVAAALLARYAYRRARVTNVWDLRGKVALVTGGSRGIGRGVCLELGRAGATVYVVGRSRKGGATDLPGQSLRGVPLGGSIDETAAEVTRLGGEGIALPCDCGNDDEMRAAIAQVEARHGRLDILVNCAIAIRDDVRQKPPFWEQPLEVYDAYHNIGTRSTYVLTTIAMPLMLRSTTTLSMEGDPRREKCSPASFGLVVNVSSPGSYRYMFNVAYGVGKSGLDRIGKDMHVDLRRANQNVSIVTLHPGMVQTERMVAHSGAFRRSMHVDVSRGESVQYTGRAVCALASNAKAACGLSGTVRTCTQVAEQLHFTDVDGRRPADPFTLRFLWEQTIPVLLQDWWTKRRARSETVSDSAGGVGKK